VKGYKPIPKSRSTNLSLSTRLTRVAFEEGGMPDVNDWNAQAMTEFPRERRPCRRPFEGTPAALVHHPGRKYVTPMTGASHVSVTTTRSLPVGERIAPSIHTMVAVAM
jgi:hypothetical protein